MSKSNFERMLQMAEDVFAVKNDPEQLEVNKEVLENLQKIHPATVSEYDDGSGPAAWILILPTTSNLMDKFLNKTITEKELYQLTTLNTTYNSVYLCSAMVLPEHRNKGIATNYTINAIQNIMQTHPIQSLFVWPFSSEGKNVANHIAEKLNLPLYSRN